MVTFLLFADGATDDGQFNDYVWHDAPTYLIGPELADGPRKNRLANIL
jgi:hypothetical protein